MSGLLPLAAYNLALEPFSPQPCHTEEFPITVRLTLAAIDPEAVDDKEEPSTLRLLKKSALLDDDEYFDMGSAEESEEEESEEEEEKPAKKSKKSQPESESEDEEMDSEDESDIEDDAVEEHILCTLSPKHQFQQSIDITITPEEEVFFVVTGSYKLHLSGNYVDHPNDESDDEIYSSSEDEDEYDLTPDEDEIISDMEYDLEELDNIEDVEGKIEELVEEDKKRKAEPEVQDKNSKKAKKEKSVKFNRELEQGPTGPAKEEKKETKKEAKKAEPKKEEKKEAKKAEPKKEVKKAEPKKVEPKKIVKTLAGGVVIEDKSVGSGPVAKKGQKVGVRYIGKLKNGKVFDKNTSGKPFQFGLGKGEVIKGWDVGVAGMAVGGERRIVIPAPMAYGKQKLPGIPANSELTFDVKLLSIK
ncbi:peptidylprolyl isomerase [Martiniozyma asiatica (nom. inval.)]|nr:peptidylprolyl isomerase [Martiniozyma asiatica]